MSEEIEPVRIILLPVSNTFPVEFLPVPPLGIEDEGAEDDEGDEGDYAGEDKLTRGAGPQLFAENSNPSAPLIQKGNTHHGERVHKEMTEDYTDPGVLDRCSPKEHECDY